MGKIYTFNNKIVTINNKWCEEYVEPTPVDPYNPLGLPANTVRVRTNNGNAPYKGTSTSYETATLVSGTTDVYDVYKSGTSFSSMFEGSTNVIEVLGANTTNVTDMNNMFRTCSNLTTIPIFDTSSVTNMNGMFRACTSLTSVPLFDTSNVTNMDYMFYNCNTITTVPLFNTSIVTSVRFMFRYCTNVQSGALALYNQMSTQTTPPSSHNYCFQDCGKNTSSGAAELAQIPSSWGGTGA